VTAFVTEDDAILRTFVDLTTAAGLRAPEDFSVATLVDPSPARSGAVDVSGLRVPRLEMGAAAVHLLGRLLDEQLDGGRDKPERQVVFPCDVVAGATAGPPPRQPREVQLR
ncbi:MAG: substrate-binding domain-containing protein, partial [Actinopolymorphaceae bacterium]